MKLHRPEALLPEQAALLPTDDDVSFYQDHGWYITPKVIRDDVIDRAIEGSERFYRGERDARLSVDSGYSDWKPTDGDTIRNNEFVSLQSYALRQLALQPIIGAIAAKLTGTSEIRLLDDQLIYKPPQGPDAGSKGTVGWHADRAYWGNCSSDRLLTAWIPFHDCELDRAPLVVIDGSHRWPGLEHLRGFNYQDLGKMESDFEQQGHPVKKVPMTLKKGQLSFHHGWTVHASYPNVSTQHRLSLAVHLQDQSNRYRRYWDNQGNEVHLFDEQLCRRTPDGDPDFSDPAVFPVLWAAA